MRGFVNGSVLYKKRPKCVNPYYIECVFKNSATRFQLLLNDAVYKSIIPRFCVVGLSQFLDFGYSILIWWQTDKKNPEAKLQGPSCLDRNANCLIIGSDNIFNIFNKGALAMHVIAHNSLTQNRNRLKFWI